MGMREGDPLPVDVDRLKPDTFVGDVITKPAVSPLIAAARRAGCGTSTGGDIRSRPSGPDRRRPGLRTACCASTEESAQEGTTMSCSP